MKKTYKYRKHIIFLGNSVKYLMGLLLAGVLLSFIISGFSIELFIMLIIFELELIFLGWFYRKFTSMSLSISDEGIEFINNKKHFKFPFSDIKSINTAKVGNLGGFFTIITKNNESIRITVTLVNISEFVLLLKQNLEAQGMGSLSSDPKLFSFYRTSAYADQSFKRIIYFWPKLVVSLVLSFLIVLGDIWYNEGILLPAFQVPLILIVIIYIFLEFAVYSPQLKKGINPETWEFPKIDEIKIKKTFNFLSYIYIVVFCITSILLYI